MCDLSGPTISNYKDSPGLPHAQSCPPITGLGALQSLKKVAVKDTGPLAAHALMDTCILSSDVSIWRTLY